MLLEDIFRENIFRKDIFPQKGRMPDKLSLPGIYYEKVINKSITLSLSFVLFLAVSYDISIGERNV